MHCGELGPLLASALPYLLALLEQLAAEQDRVVMRIHAVYLGMGHAVVEGVFQDELNVASGKRLAVLALQAELGYLVPDSRQRVVAGRVQLEQPLDEVRSFRIKDDVFLAGIEGDIHVADARPADPIAYASLLLKRTPYMVADSVGIVLGQSEAHTELELLHGRH